MYPELFHLGPLVIRSYSVIMDISILLGLAMVYFEAKRVGFPINRLIDVVIAALFGGIVGARLYFIAVNWPLFQSDFAGMLRIWEGGLVLHGAILGSMLGAYLYLRHARMSFLALADIGMPAALLTQGVGRLACVLNGCCFGEPTTLPWGISLPLAVDDIPRHPTPLYELTGDLIVLGILWSLRKRKPFDGFILALYMILYSAVRVVVEFWRGDVAEMFGELRVAQLVSIVIMALGFALMGYLSWRSSRLAQPKLAEAVSTGSSTEEEA